MKTFTINDLKFSRTQAGGIAMATGLDCTYYLDDDTDEGWSWSVLGTVSLGATEADCVAAANKHHHARVASQFLTEAQ